jgi:hypothetical protein
VVRLTKQICAGASFVGPAADLHSVVRPTALTREHHLASRALGTCLLLAVTPLALLSGQASTVSEPRHAYYLDELAKAFEVPPLRAGKGFPDGHREIRIWIGFGLFQPQTFTRIQSDGRSVTGSHLFWWATATDSLEEAEADRDPKLMSNAELYASLRKAAGCGALRRHDGTESCAATLGPGQSWAGVLASLDSLGIATLPDGKAFGLDGWRVVVELRDGASYRTYSYLGARIEHARSRRPSGGCHRASSRADRQPALTRRQWPNSRIQPADAEAGARLDGLLVQG